MTVVEQKERPLESCAISTREVAELAGSVRERVNTVVGGIVGTAPSDVGEEAPAPSNIVEEIKSSLDIATRNLRIILDEINRL